MKKLNTAYLLIGCAAIAQGVLWVNAFKMLHSDILAYVGGIPAGIAIVGLSARSANILPGVKSKRARQWGWTLLVILMITEPFVLGAANYHAMGDKSYIVAYGASLVISVALVMGAIVERSLVAKPKATKSKPKSEPKPEKPAFTCACGRSFGSQAALNGHQSAHKPKGYAVEFTPIEKVEKN